MATDLILRLIFHFFMTIGICILIHVIFSGVDSYENFLAIFIPLIFFAVSTTLAFIAVQNYIQSNSDEKNCYEITVNEKSFKTSDFKTKLDGSIEFTANDGTVIRASEYEIKKLN